MATPFALLVELDLYTEQDRNRFKVFTTKKLVSNSKDELCLELDHKGQSNHSKILHALCQCNQVEC